MKKPLLQGVKKTAGIGAESPQVKGNKFLGSKGTQTFWSSEYFLIIMDCLII